MLEDLEVKRERLIAKFEAGEIDRWEAAATLATAVMSRELLALSERSLYNGHAAWIAATMARLMLLMPLTGEALRQAALEVEN